jgi:hypothetical protein
LKDKNVPKALQRQMTEGANKAVYPTCVALGPGEIFYLAWTSADEITWDCEYFPIDFLDIID